MLKRILTRFNILHKLTAVTTNNALNNGTFFRFIIDAIKRMHNNDDIAPTLPLQMTKLILPPITDEDRIAEGFNLAATRQLPCLAHMF